MFIGTHPHRKKNRKNFLILIYATIKFYSFAIIVQEIVSRQGVFYLGNTSYLERTPKGKVLKFYSPVFHSFEIFSDRNNPISVQSHLHEPTI